MHAFGVFDGTFAIDPNARLFKEPFCAVIHLAEKQHVVKAFDGEFVKYCADGVLRFVRNPFLIIRIFLFEPLKHTKIINPQNEIVNKAVEKDEKVCYSYRDAPNSGHTIC